MTSIESIGSGEHKQKCGILETHATSARISDFRSTAWAIVVAGPQILYDQHLLKPRRSIVFAEDYADDNLAEKRARTSPPEIGVRANVAFHL